MTTHSSSAPGDIAQLTAYLLDRLPDEQARQQIEERYFNDDAYFILAGACEQDLIRDYLLRNLTPDDMRRFERKYLGTPGLRDKVEICAAIMTVTGTALPVTPGKSNLPPRSWRFAAAAAILIGAVLLAWQQLRISRMEAQLGRMWARSAASVTAKSAPPVLAFALRPALDRDARSGMVALRIPPANAEVRFSLEIERGNEAGAYRAALTLPGGSEIWSAFVPGGSPAVEVTVPSAAMVPGDYVLTLDGRDGRAHQAYSFRVLRG